MNKKGLIILIAGLLCVAAAIGLFINNALASRHAEESAQKITEELEKKISEENSGAENAFPTDNPYREMPTVTVGGQPYIGILSVPESELTLPVLASFDYDSLQETPCLYSGSIYRKNMVIGAHNYDSHFGRIDSLSQGSRVIFTDTENHRYDCEVVSMETLKPDQNDELTKKFGNDWDISLFTCNYSGSARIVVRCRIMGQS